MAGSQIRRTPRCFFTLLNIHTNWGVDAARAHVHVHARAISHKHLVVFFCDASISDLTKVQLGEKDFIKQLLPRRTQHTSRGSLFKLQISPKERDTGRESDRQSEREKVRESESENIRKIINSVLVKS